MLKSGINGKKRKKCIDQERRKERNLKTNKTHKKKERSENLRYKNDVEN